MPHDEAASLSDELEELIGSLYAPLDQSSVRETLMSYAAANPRWETDRVQFDLLHLGAGDAKKVGQLAKVAARDPRDVMSGEYFRRAGRSYPHPWARRHAVNRDWAEPPERNPDPLCTAQLFFRTQPGGALGRTLRTPSLNLAFDSEVQLLNFGEQLLSLTGPDRVIDLSRALDFKGQWLPESTSLRCVRDGDAATLTCDGNLLIWSGDAGYWAACRATCLRLAESGGGSQDIVTQEATNQRIRITLCATAHS